MDRRTHAHISLMGNIRKKELNRKKKYQEKNCFVIWPFLFFSTLIDLAQRFIIGAVRDSFFQTNKQTNGRKIPSQTMKQLIVENAKHRKNKNGWVHTMRSAIIAIPQCLSIRFGKTSMQKFPEIIHEPRKSRDCRDEMDKKINKCSRRRRKWRHKTDGEEDRKRRTNGGYYFYFPLLCLQCFYVRLHQLLLERFIYEPKDTQISERHQILLVEAFLQWLFSLYRN